MAQRVVAMRMGAKLAYFCSMKITQEVRDFAAQKEIEEQMALDVGLKEKAAEFLAAGGEIYVAEAKG